MRNGFIETEIEELNEILGVNAPMFRFYIWFIVEELMSFLGKCVLDDD